VIHPFEGLGVAVVHARASQRTRRVSKDAISIAAVKSLLFRRSQIGFGTQELRPLATVLRTRLRCFLDFSNVICFCLFLSLGFCEVVLFLSITRI
jgi:hypothetical protein